MVDMRNAYMKLLHARVEKLLILKTVIMEHIP